MKRTTPRGQYRVEFKVRALAALDANGNRRYDAISPKLVKKRYQ